MLAWIRHSASAILPAGLRSRLTLTVLLTNLIVLTVIALGLLLGIRAARPELEDSAASALLTQIRQGVAQQANTVSASLTPLGVATRMEDAIATNEIPENLTSTLEAYAREMDALAFVFLSGDGSRLFAYGQSTALVEFETFVSRPRTGQPESGPLEIDGVPCVVALRPVLAPEPAVTGWLAVARPLDPRLLPAEGELEIASPGRTPPSPAVGRQLDDAHFERVRVLPGRTQADPYILEANLPGIDGRPAASITYSGTLSLQPFTMAFAIAALLGVIAAALLGVAFGLFAIRDVSNPVSALALHVHRSSADAIAGHEVEPMPTDPSMPREIAGLVETFNGMLGGLARHQAALAEANAETASAKEALEIAFHNSLEGKVLIVDGVVSLVNPAAATHLSIVRGSAAGHELTDVLSAVVLEDAQEHPMKPSALIESSGVEPLTVRVKAPGRSPRWLEVHSIAHEHSPGTLLLTTRDVTEERRLEELRNEIMGLVSHDLRAPLTVIVGYLDLLERDLDAESRGKAVGSAKRSAARMQTLLEDLLSATRAEEIFTPVELEPVCLRDLADDIVVSFQHASPHEFRLEARSDGMVLGEEKRLRQVLVNLVTNAMKYSPPDTRIDVTVDRLDDFAIIAVEDEGPGVPPDKRESIFQRFARLESRDGERRPGVGLGLYIVRAIIEGHGGSVFAEDRAEGTGARFVVKLPLAPGDEDGVA